MSKEPVDIALGKLLPKLKDVALNICIDYNKADDVVSMVIESLLNQDREVLQDIHDKGGLLWYCIRCITLSVHSKTSRYYYKYDKYYEKIDSNHCKEDGSYTSFDNISKGLYDSNTDDKEIQLQAVSNLLDNMYWYDKELFNTYFKGGYTLDKLSEKTGISRMSIFNTIKKVKKYLRDNINEEANKITDSKDLY